MDTLRQKRLDRPARVRPVPALRTCKPGIDVMRPAVTNHEGRQRS